MKTKAAVLVGDFLRENERTAAWMGRHAGISASRLSRILLGHERPTLMQAVSIEQFTAGVVPCRAWIEPTE